MFYTNIYNSPIGKITLASNGSGLTGLWFNGQKYFAEGLSKDFVKENLPVFAQTEKWLDIYFSGDNPNFIPPLSIENASNFRKQVWKILLSIPFGQTTTYGKIAKQIEQETGKRVSAQAVGGAVGHNPIAIVIPCHRVVGTNGNLTGYAGGIDKKAFLLQLEGNDLPPDFCDGN